MLKIRVLTAAVLVPLFVLGVLKLPGSYFSILIGIVVLLGAWEWSHLAGYDEAFSKLSFVLVSGLLMAALFAYQALVAEPVLILSCVIWLVTAIMLWRRRTASPLDWPAPARLASGLWTLIPAWLAVSLLHRVDPGATLMLFLLIWGADTSAYFTGRRLGRRRLAPAISPGKTWEGLWGALIAGLLLAVVFAVFRGLDRGGWAALAALAVAVVVLSVVGDLFESNWKRVSRLKDSGGLLPGHGGVLDRIDSMTSAAPFFTLGWAWWFGSLSS